MKRVQDVKDQWAIGTYVSEADFHATVSLNAAAIGGCKAMEDILELTAEEVNKELSNV